MRFSVLIAERFKKILLLSLSAAVVGLTVYGLMWSLHNRERSKEFILSHLKEVVVAEVQSQNTFNIDGELNRIVDSWSKTQEFPLRVDVYLDGKHWAHGGPMQPFGIFSTRDSHSEILATGQKLDLDMSMDLTGPLLRLLGALIIFIGFFIVVYFSLKKGLAKAVEEISKPLEERVANLSQASQNLSSHAKKGFSAPETQVDELQRLDDSLGTLFSRINALEGEVAEKKYSEGQLQMAKQVGHALNGTLSAFSIYVDQAKPIDPLDKKFLRGIIEQITSISSDLSESRTENSGASSAQIFDLTQSVKNVVNQKTQEALKLNDKKIEIGFFGTDKSLMLSGSKAKFELALVNLVTNSIEAIKSTGAITVAVDQDNDNAIVRIVDNGCGIAAINLPHLMNEGATYGKVNGHGLGLFHVKSIVEEFQGTISISSNEGIGTEIKIKVPIIKPETSKSEIVLFQNQQLIIVDDENCIHQTWDILLKKFAGKIHITHLNSVAEFENWIFANNHGPFESRLFLFDYDLKGHMTGLELIEKHQIMFESYLVTGMASDVRVVEESKRLKVKTISKDELPNLQLRLDENILSSQEPRFLEAT